MRASTRGPGWQRASRGNFNPGAQRVIEARASAVSLGNQGRTDLELGQRVFHGKFGYGTIAAIEGNKLEIDFSTAAARKCSTASSARSELREISGGDMKDVSSTAGGKVGAIDGLNLFSAPCSGPI